MKEEKDRDLERKQNEIEDLCTEIGNIRAEKAKSIELLQKQCEQNIIESKEIVNRLQDEIKSALDNVNALKSENSDLRRKYQQDLDKLRGEIDKGEKGDHAINTRSSKLQLLKF